MVKVHPLPNMGYVLEAIEICEIISRKVHVIPVDQIEAWFRGTFYCINPETGAYCDTANMKVRWVGKDIASWASMRKFMGRVMITTLNYDLIAEFPAAPYPGAVEAYWPSYMGWITK